jgi:hypothetical protein
MAPILSNNTGCLFIDYSVAGEDHTMLFRYGVGSDAAAVADIADLFLTALDTSMYEITILGARHRFKDADIALPFTWTGADHYGADGGEHTNTAWYMDFVGRSTGGRRVRVAVFGSKNFEDDADHDYRLPATGALADALQALNDGAGEMVAIDGETPVWYNYVNVGVNAYWRNRIR